MERVDGLDQAMIERIAQAFADEGYDVDLPTRLTLAAIALRTTSCASPREPI